MSLRLTSCAAAFAALVCLSLGCSPPRHATGENPPATRPNVVWVIWDTVRADHLSAYGYSKPTTPKLERWARSARVYERCLSTAGQTLPSTASMFTGLFPSEHGTNPAWSHLDDRFVTIAELFQGEGYRTYLFSANAYLSSEHNFHRGFQTEEHPWDERYVADALRIVQAKLDPDRTGKRARIHASPPRKGDIKASGQLAQRGLEQWLQDTNSEQPFFALLNYMEAHRPYIPTRRYRERMMTADQVNASYALVVRPWEYTFRLREYSDEEIELINGLYDAALLELDDLFADLLAGLEASSHLENTVVVLTSDHGEHLGDHHMLDHQFSLYEGLLHVPLIVHFPREFPPGRDPRPVSTMDLFPTLLELAGIDPPEGLTSKGVSLLASGGDRLLFSEYPVVHPSVDNTARRHPSWDPSPWRRTLRAIYEADIKHIEADDGHMELYRLSDDPLETNNLAESERPTAERMSNLLRTFVASLSQWDPTGPAPEMSREQIERLEALGYLGAN